MIRIASGKLIVSTAPLAALADSLAIAGYALMGSPVAFQAVGILLKASLFVLAGLHRSSPLRQAWLPLMLFAIILLISSMFGEVRDLTSVLVVLLILANIGLTLALICPASFESYTFALSGAVAGSNIIYVISALAGRIEEHFGRFAYFEGTHPNLGSEIAAVGVICAAMTFRLRLLAVIALAAPCLWATILMQGRSAQLTIVTAVALRCAITLARGRKLSAVAIVLGACSIFFASVALNDQLSQRVSAALLLDDVDRGAGTGFVGRSDRWNVAIDTFLSHPLVGIGPGSFDAESIPSPHNLYLYGLAELGLLSVFFFYILIRYASKAARLNPRHALVLSPILILTVFNDRFLNLNPYPAELYILLFALGYARVGSNETRARSRYPRSRSVTFEPAAGPHKAQEEMT